jgi:hypothetical protein
MSFHKLSKDQFDLIAKTIKHDLFDASRSVKEPVAVFLGGQPAAGKTASIPYVLKEIASATGAAVIDGDLLRDYHPYHKLLVARDRQLRQADSRTPISYLAEDIRALKEEAIRHAITERYHVLICDPMGKPNWITQKMRDFDKAGFHIDVRVIATPSPFSWQSQLLRYEKESTNRGRPRFPSPREHEKACNALVETLKYIQENKLSKRVTIHRRDGPKIYTSELKEDQWSGYLLAHAVLLQEHHRAWSLTEQTVFVDNFEKIRAMMNKWGATSEQAAGVETLQTESLRKLGIIEIEAPECSKDTFFGRIEAVTESGVYQILPGNQLIRHARSTFEHLPNVGDLAVVKYHDGCARLIQPNIRDSITKSRPVPLVGCSTYRSEEVFLLKGRFRGRGRGL